MNNENTCLDGNENSETNDEVVRQSSRVGSASQNFNRDARSEGCCADRTPQRGVPTSDTQTSSREPSASRSRTGKIARLPLAVRQELNQRLQNGEPGKALVGWLNGLPEVQAVLAAQFQGQPIGQENLSRWKRGGYLSWEAEQRALGAAARLAEQSAGLREAVKEGLVDHITVVLTAKMAVELERLEVLSDGEEKSKIMRDLLGSLILLKRGNTQDERLVVEREKLGFRRERHLKEIETKFWEWATNEDNREAILARLLTPEQNDQEIERSNQEKRRQIKEVLGAP